MARFLIVIIVSLIPIVSIAQEIKKIKITELEKIISESKTPLIINFWATWCKPCLEEIPYFMKETKKHSSSFGSTDSLQLLLVSLDMEEDFPKKIRKAVRKNKINFPVFWLDEINADYFCPKIDRSWSGAIPATLFINNKTGYRSFFEGQLSPEKFVREIKNLLND